MFGRACRLIQREFISEKENKNEALAAVKLQPRSRKIKVNIWLISGKESCRGKGQL